MTTASEFLKQLEMIGETDPLISGLLATIQSRSNDLSFEDILTGYAHYSDELPDVEKKKLSTIIWGQIKLFGTPIIEYDAQDSSQCKVYFLFPKDKLENNDALYLQGAFHGYGGLRQRNMLSELSTTGMMYRIDSIPTNALLNYQYQQEGGSSLIDDYSIHGNVYHHRYAGGIMLRVTPNRDESHLGKRLGQQEEENYWANVISAKRVDLGNHFNYCTTLYSDLNNTFQTCDAPLPQRVDIYNPVPADLTQIPDEDLTGSPYANFTRAIHVFKSVSDEAQVKHVIVFNDGRPYILAGMLEQAEKMVNAGKLSSDTALIFIDTLQGLAKTMPGIEKDERFNLGGMGVRIIDFDKGRDAYIAFLKKLFAYLKNTLAIPDESRSRVMVGASLSGTATIYVALTEPALFKAYITQSPSPSNDEILMGLISNHEANIQLSCGVFEQPQFNDAETDCYNYAKQLEARFGLAFDQKSFHGHNHAAWVVDLEKSLPVLLEANRVLAKQSFKSPAVSAQSFFSPSPTTTQENSDKSKDAIFVIRKKGG